MAVAFLSFFNTSRIKILFEETNFAIEQFKKLSLVQLWHILQNSLIKNQKVCFKTKNFMQNFLQSLKIGRINNVISDNIFSQLKQNK